MVSLDGNGLNSRAHFLPAQRHKVIYRRNLVNRALNNSPALAILQGPGGIGKSVAAAQIAEEFIPRVQNSDAVWVRFRPGLTSYEAVWQHILTECVNAGTLPANSVAGRVAEGGMSTPTVLYEALRERTSPLLLILDNAHESITTKVEESLITALEQLSSLTVVITTRRPLPLIGSAKTALRIPVTSFNTQDLHLSESEVQELVSLRTPDESNPHAVSQMVYQHSKGWPLAVHALLVERNNHPNDTIAPLDAVPQRTFIQDIVNALTDDTHTLTQHTLYVLAQYREMPLDALASTLGIDGQTSSALINGTLIEHLDYWVDHRGVHWYQLHDLIGQEILERQESLISEDDRKRYGHRVSVHLREARPRIAMQAAIIAQDWEVLSDLLLEGSAITLSRQQLPITLSDIPEDVRSEYPVIAAFSLIHEYAFPSGAFGKAVAGFRAYSSRALVARSNQPGVPGATAAILKMVISRITGKEKLALAMAQKVTQKLDELSNAERRRYSAPLQIGVNQAVITYLHMGNFSEAKAMLNLMHAWRERLQPKSRAHAAALAAWATAFCGETKEARKFLDECEQLDVPVGWRDSYIGAGYRIAAVLLALEHKEYSLAQQHIDAMVAHESTIEHWPYLAYVQALVIEARDGAGAALVYLKARSSQKGAKTSTTVFTRKLLYGLKARLSWQQGMILPLRNKGPLSLGSVYVALSRNDTSTAISLIVRLKESTPIHRNGRAYAELILLQSMIAFQQGNTPLAADHARTAVSIMEANGTYLPMRAIPQEIARGLHAFVPELPVSHAAKVIFHDIEPLSPAEHKALIAIAENGTISQAAKAMYLSRETVKGYMKSVYRKLKVNSRDEAVAVASTTGLLSHSFKDDNDVL